MKTSGLSAEYGGALGGVISAVTKSGGNDFNGSRLLLLQRRLPVLHQRSRREARPRPGHPEPRLHSAGLRAELQSPRRRRLAGRPDHQGQALLLRLDLAGVRGPQPRLRARHRAQHGPAGPQGPEQLREAHLGRDERGCGSTSPPCRPRRRPTGTLVAFDGADANGSTQTAEGVAANNDRGYEVPQWQAAGTVDYVLSNSTLLSLRAGYFHDSYEDTGRQHEPDLRIRRVVGGPRRRAVPVPAAGRLLQPPARPGQRSRPHDAQVRQPGAHDRARRPRAPTASSSAAAGRAPRTTSSSRTPTRASSPSSGTRASPARRPARPAGEPTATTRSTTRGRSARPAPTSCTCSCRTPGGSPRS